MAPRHELSQLIAASPTRTALIFALEPVFAAFFAWLWIGEPLTLAVWIGGGVMLTGILFAEVQGWPRWLVVGGQ